MKQQDNKIERQNPLNKFRTEEFPMQKQKAPGLQSAMEPLPDSGEESYVGHGRLKGVKALITGGDSGIGRAVAVAYVREGAEVAINYLPFEEKDAESLADLLKKEGKEVILLPGDLSNEATARKIVKEAHEKLNGLNVLVLNAAVQTAVESIAQLSTKQLRHTFDVNVFALYWMVQEALPLLPEGSSIIFTSSTEFYKPSYKLIDYAASKYAVVGFGKALAKELVVQGIRVNTVLPGPIWTPLEISGGLLNDDIPSHGRGTLMDRAGQPVELAGIYVFLASEEASYVTCETFGVSGGLDGV